MRSADYFGDLAAWSTAFLKGHSAESRLCPFLYLIDDPGKWRDLNELKKSNLNKGISVSAEYYRGRGKRRESRTPGAGSGRIDREVIVKPAKSFKRGISG